MNKKAFSKFFAGATLATAIVTPAFAAYEGYYGYSLPAFQGNNYTNVHNKIQTADDIMNIVDKYTGTDQATFWATDGAYNQISGDYFQKVSPNPTVIYFNNGIDKGPGDQVALGMENSTFSTGTAWVDGRVDFE